MFGVKDPIPCELLTSFYAWAVMPAMSAKPLDIYPHANVSTSHILRHPHNSPHSVSDECFNILDHASTTFQLQIKEAIQIQWEKPRLNHQLYHVNLKLSCKCTHCSVTIVCFVQSAFCHTL